MSGISGADQFDNAKLRSVVPNYVFTVPYEQGAREIVAWYDEDPSRQRVDLRLDALMDRLVETYRVDRRVAEPPSRAICSADRCQPYG